MVLTRTQRSNLAKLADYLESLPEDYSHFEMRDYAGLRETDPVLVKYARENGGVAQCGTVACAVGHGPAAGILFRRKADFYTRADGTSVLLWEPYSARFVPRDGDEELEFDWAFGSPWAFADNHHWGAAARIRYLLKHGVPEDFYGRCEAEFKDTYREFDKRYAAQVQA